MATLKSVKADDVDDVFLDTDELADADLTLYKQGDQHQTVTFDGIVNEDQLEGTREVQGDGVYKYRGDGNIQRESISIRCKASVPFQAHQGRRPDLVRARGELWTVMMVIGRDDNFQTVLCARMDRNWTVRPTMV